MVNKKDEERVNREEEKKESEKEKKGKWLIDEIRKLENIMGKSHEDLANKGNEDLENIKKVRGR